jgi:hypothetical protein
MCWTGDDAYEEWSFRDGIGFVAGARWTGLFFALMLDFTG